MKKWALIGGGLMLVAWAPFLYAELTSSPAAKKGRELPNDEPTVVGAEQKPEPAAAAEPSAEPEPAAAEKPAPADKEASATAKDPEPQPSAKPATAAQAKADPSEPGEPDPGEGPTDEAVAADQEAAPPPTTEGPTDVLKKAFDTQPRDALWAKDAEARIGGLFGTADVPAEMLQNATCRKAVCRVEVRWTREHATAFVAMFQAAHQGFGSDVGIEPIGTLDEDGHQQVDLYLPRKGYTVADLSK